MLTPSFSVGYFEAAFSGAVFVASFAYLFGGARVSRWRFVDIAAWLSIAVLATVPSQAGLVLSAMGLALMIWLRHRHRITSLSCQKAV